MNEFKLGDIVKLKCGGRKMIVSTPHYQSGTHIKCSWHDKYGKPHDSLYLPELLKISMVKK